MSTRSIQFAVRIQNRGCPASLDVGKIYRVSPDREASAHGMIRVVDESSEASLYPQSHFGPVELREAARQALAASL